MPPAFDGRIDTIPDVLAILDQIIADCEEREDPLGYFAALYRTVTWHVQCGIDQNFFDDGERMTRFDVLFARRYLDAYFAFRQGQPCTSSWHTAFSSSRQHDFIVLQHLLLGINAHINLDLGIVAAEISRDKPLQELYNDFCRINAILSSLVAEVQDNLAAIWPFLKRVLTRTGEFDDYLIDFSMEIAREGAWQFAQTLHEAEDDWMLLITSRDERVSRVARVITHPKTIIRILLWIIRLGERGDVAGKIGKLKGTPETGKVINPASFGSR